MQASQSGAPTISDPRIRQLIYDEFSHLYNFEFQNTENIIRTLKRQYNQSPWTYVLCANYYWWKIISGEHTDENTDQFMKSLAASQHRIGQTQNYENMFLRILISSYRSRYDLLDANYVSTISEIRKQIYVIKSSFGLEDKYPAFYLTSGLYYYMVDNANTNHLFLRPLLYFFPKGDRNKGIRYLNRKTGDIILETESNYYLMKIYDEIESNYSQSIRYAEQLYKQYPNNYIFARHYYDLLTKTRKSPLTNSEVNEINRQILSNNQLSEGQKSYFFVMLQKLQSSGS